MDHGRFDRLARAMAAGSSRRSVLRCAAGSVMTSPLALFGISAAAAQGNRNKDKDKDKKDTGSQGNQGGPGASGCRGEGHPCEGNQVCCAGLVCPDAKGETPQGNARRCTKAQNVVTTQTQVCTDDCPQTNQPVLVENKELFGTPPSYWIDVVCTFDAPLYRTVCDSIAYGQSTAPAVPAKGATGGLSIRRLVNGDGSSVPAPDDPARCRLGEPRPPAWSGFAMTSAHASGPSTMPAGS